ncbi:hypothetical protein DD236_09180 [Ancrocorticia populi]|uniref:Uncharacterized protein n=1 Tax=Ancrocorticia populi TaxID=2175228 RepID=A0A2V1K4M3_9ACTO|nr:hypothetical protein DD236_09180 [Ancrocorticia populi]
MSEIPSFSTVQIENRVIILMMSGRQATGNCFSISCVWKYVAACMAKESGALVVLFGFLKMK